MEGRGDDGVALALLENSGVDAKALDEQLQVRRPGCRTGRRRRPGPGAPLLTDLLRSTAARAQALEIAEKRSWLATCLAHLHQPSASLASGQGLAGPVELECKRDQLIQHMCRELSRGQGLAGDLSSGVTIRSMLVDASRRHASCSGVWASAAFGLPLTQTGCRCAWMCDPTDCAGSRARPAREPRSGENGSA